MQVFHPLMWRRVPLAGLRGVGDKAAHPPRHQGRCGARVQGTGHQHHRPARLRCQDFNELSAQR